MEKDDKQQVIPIPDEIIEKMKQHQEAWQQAMCVMPKSVLKNIAENAMDRMVDLYEFDKRCIEADRRGDPHRFDGPIPMLLGEIKDRKIRLSEDAKKHWEDYLKGVWPKEDKDAKPDTLTEIAMAMLRGETIPARKNIRIEIELDYPSCDIYPTREIMEFLEESFLEWINANLSDGDERLKMTHISVTSEGVTMTKK